MLLFFGTNLCLEAKSIVIMSIITVYLVNALLKIPNQLRAKRNVGKISE